MAKEQIHNYVRTLMTVGTLIFVCGMTYRTLQHNEGDIRTNAENTVKLDEKVDAVKDDVHRVELDAKDIKAIAVQGVESFASINMELKAIRGEQIKAATIQAVNSEKLKTLTKD